MDLVGDIVDVDVELDVDLRLDLPLEDRRAVRALDRQILDILGQDAQSAARPPVRSHWRGWWSPGRPCAIASSLHRAGWCRARAAMALKKMQWRA